jgi:DNA-binding MarR family transcriptional regulator
MTILNELLDDKDYRLNTLILITINAIVKAEEQELKQLGLSMEEAGALFITEAIGEQATPAEIARWMFREHPSVSDLLRRMQKKELVTLTKDLEWKNMIRVGLTEKGKRAFVGWKSAKTRHQIGAVLSEEERQQLSSSLEKLRSKALEKLAIDYKPPYP